MARKRWCVRIVTPGEGVEQTREEKALDTNGWLLECLRYAHIIRIHRANEKGLCFDLLAPASISNEASHTWALANAERISGYRLNAVAAPEWPAPGAKP